MEISCPNCSKKYRVEDSLIPAEGRKVRCRRCEHVFSVSRPEPEVESAAPEDVQLDLDLDSPEEAVGGGTVRISQDQIDASIRKMNQGPAASTGADDDEEAELEREQDIQLDLDTERAEGPSVSGYADQQMDAGTAGPRNRDEMSGEILYRVRIDGKEYTDLDIDMLKEWIKEDRLLENDEISREGSNVWARAETVPDLKKAFKLHIYEQRKQFDEEDNPYLRFKAKQEGETAAKSGGFLDKLKRMLGMG